MRDGKFNGPATLDLFGCAGTIKEAMEMFKEFELPMASLTRVWGIARARAEVAQSNQTDLAGNTDPTMKIPSIVVFDVLDLARWCYRERRETRYIR